MPVLLCDAMFDTKTRTVVVVGTQWGNEGNGKFSDVMAEPERREPAGAVADGSLPLPTCPRACASRCSRAARVLKLPVRERAPDRPAEESAHQSTRNAEWDYHF